MISIRAYAASDYEQLKSILDSVCMFDAVWDSEANVLGMIQHEANAVLVALVQEKIVGCVYSIAFGSQVAFIFRLAVLPEFQSRGVGSALLNAVIENGKQKGVQEFGLFVDQTDTSLNAFYAARGFGSSQKPWVYRYTA
jgi:ribosomal protein S18 acetylase RimI-like enzyme